MSDLKKTLDIAAAGDTLVQEEVDKVLADLIERDYPLRKNLPRKPGSGKAWIIVRRTAASSADFVDDIEEPSETESTYDRKTFDYKTILRRGKVSRKLQAVGKTYIDAKTEEIEEALETIRMKEEYGIIWGDITNPKQFDGLHKLIPAGQTVEAGVNGGALTLAMLDEVIDKCLGVPSMIICSKRTRREINALLQLNQRFVDVREVKGGFKVMSYNELPIFVNSQVGDAQTQGTAGNASSLYVINTTDCFMGVLTELTMKDLAKTSSQFDKFDVFEDMALVLRNEKKCAKVVGIIPPTP